MEIISIVWKVSYVVHMISNAGFFGSTVLAFFDCKNICNSFSIGKLKKILSLFLTLSGLTGIVLLSILSMGGMDDLTSNNIGLSIIVMIFCYILVLFSFIFFLIYKGGDLKIDKFLLGFPLLIYLFVYIFRVILVH